MPEIQTDYLVIGAGASGMAFVDALINEDPNVDVVMVDREHRPGGHWLHAYPFVRIHQTSVNYGVNSRVLGIERIDETGPNAGFYERATGHEICAYFNRVMEEDMVPSGRVRFLPRSDYRGEDGDGHQVVSLLTGETTTVKVRQKVVDGTYVGSEIPSRHTPSFEVDPDVRLIPPNDVVDVDESAAGFTVIGAGKTGMDTCVWLIDQGVAPDRIRWIKSRDMWLMDRAYLQPLDNVGSYMDFQARWVAAIPEAESGADWARRVAASGVFVRVDEDVEPTGFRGAMVSEREVDVLRSIENVVRLGRVRRITSERMTLDEGEVTSVPGEVYVDCTAAGVRAPARRPIFEPGRITLQLVTLGIIPWGSATVGAVEAMRDDDAEKNRLCPPIRLTGDVSDEIEMLYAGMSGVVARGAEPDIAAWNDASRLNPAKGALDHMDDPRVPAAFGSLASTIGPAMENLERLVRAPSASPV